MPIEYATPRGPNECDAYARIVAEAFAWDPEMAIGWVRDWGHACVRVVLVDGVLAGGLQLIPLQTYFGGRAVGLTGVGAVVLLPQYRGKGVGKALMREAMLESQRSGVPLAGLFPATLPVYRSAGFEQAGVRCETTFTLNQIKLRPEIDALVRADRGLSLVPIHNDESVRAAVPEPGSIHEKVRGVYARVAPHFDGHLARPDNVWRTQIYAFKREQTKGFAIVRDATGAVEGYFFYTQSRGDGGIHVAVRDAACVTPGAWAAFLRFLADHWSTAREATWMVPAEHPALSMLAEHCTRTKLSAAWMLRVMDVKAAIEARGYGPSVRASFALRVRDELFAANHATWKVSIADGRANVSKGSDAEPAIELDVRALSPILSGYQSPAALRLAGLACCDDDAMLDAAATAFANGRGSTPWMGEIY
jgi:predicted acetyltransferase